MTDEKVETPKVYRWDSKGMSMDEHPGYCQYIDKADYDAKCAELERVKGERDAALSDPMNAGWEHAQYARKDRENAIGHLKNEIAKREKAEQRATTAEAERDRFKAIAITNGDDLDECRAALEKARENEGRWIPVSERVPDLDYMEQEVMVYFQDRVTILYWNRRWCWADGSFMEAHVAQDITHWMPLPEPPAIDAARGGGK